MEVTLSPISSCIPNISSFHSPRRRLLRKQFLGSGHNLRPPGLIRCYPWSIGFQLRLHSRRRFTLRAAALDSQSIFIVAAVVTVSALTIVYLNFSKRNAKTKDKEMSGQITHSIFWDIRSMMNWVIEEWFPLYVNLDKVMSIDEKEVKQINHGSKDMVADMHFVEGNVTHTTTLAVDATCPTLAANATHITTHASSATHTTTLAANAMHTATLASNATPTTTIAANATHTKTLAANAHEFSNPNLVASVISDLSVNRESGGTSLVSLTPSISDASAYSLDRQMHKTHQAGGGQETGSDNKLPMVMVERDPNTASFPSIHKQKGSDKPRRPNHQLSEEGEESMFNLFYRDNLREGLYTFYEAPMADFNDQGAFLSRTSLQENDRSLFLKSSAVDGAKYHRSELLHPSDNTEGERTLAYHEGGSFQGRNDTGERKEFRTNKEKIIFHQNRTKDSSASHNIKGKHISERPHPSQQFDAYNQLLRVGRLNDCIEMLEEMESKGLLDMDKVYHAGFFQVCKRKKAVKEAFRFTKLIQNPTLSTFNMHMSVCANSQDSEGAFQVLQLVQEAGLEADCKLYTTLISTCAKSGKVDTMFKVFHEMVNAGVEPNVHTYGALIDGCAKAGQVAKAFGAYGIMRSKNVKPDRVVFNALITACGESGALDRAFDVLAEMRAETQPIDPDHVTVGALMKACANVGQVDRAREVYKMIDEYNIKGTPEVYTIAVNCCSQNGDWGVACRVYNDMMRKGVLPDEMFISALIDVAGHAGKIEAAFEILQAARGEGIHPGIIAYSSLMGACSNAKDWQKALQLYEDIKDTNLKPTVSMMNALVTALCDADELQKATEVLFEMKRQGLCPNTITYSILLVASDKKNDLEVGLMLLSQAKKDGVAPNLVMCRCIIGMCLRRFQQACTIGEPVLSISSGRLQLDSKWTSLALMVYREAIAAGVTPTVEELSQVLGCLKLPHDVALRNRLVENLGVSANAAKDSKLCSLVDGFGEYDPRAFSILEEAASLGIVPAVSLKQSPIIVDVGNLQIPTAEVYLLTVLKGLKHRLAAGAKLPNLTILLPSEKTQIQTPRGEKTINLAGRVSQAVASLLRRLGISYLGNESHGKIRIHGVTVKKWFKPKLGSPFSGKPTERRLGQGIYYQQRSIRTGNLSLD